MRRRAFVTGLSLLAVEYVYAAHVAACARSDRPEEPVWGKQPCAHCAMLVSDKRYAAQATMDGERRFFDDIGCMVLWADERRAPPHPAWVRDAEQGTWVDARGARYAEGAKTPMDFGFEARAAGGLAWDEMRARVIQRKKAER